MPKKSDADIGLPAKPGSQTSGSLLKVQFVSIDSESAGQRIDNFLLTYLKRLPKSRVYRLLRKGEVRVNKGRIKPEYKLQEGDVIRIPPVFLPSENAPVPAGEALKSLLESRILFEDDRLLVINKPSGLAVHGGSGINLGLIEVLRQMRPQAKSLELVHRLDRETSGCLLVAKRKSILRYLQNHFREGVKGIQKTYLALVNGSWPKRKTQVSAPLKKNELQGGERMVRVDVEGKASLTEFSIVDSFSDFTLVAAEPVTGRTHQIRVHALSVGHSLAGDDKYGDDQVNRELRNLGLKRLFLHAAKLSFVLPPREGQGKGERLTVEAALDDDLAGVLLRLPRK